MHCLLALFVVSVAVAIRQHVNTAAIFGRMQFCSGIECVGCTHAFKTAYWSSSTAGTVTVNSNFGLSLCNEHDVRNIGAVLE